MLLAFSWSAQAGAPASLSVTNSSVTEGDSGTVDLNFSVVRSGDTSTNLVVPYSIEPGTASTPGDYTAPGTGAVLRIPAGQIQGTITVPVIGDVVVEADETLQLNLGTPAAYNPAGDLGMAPRYAIGQSPDSSVSADFNGDGKADLAMRVYSSGTQQYFISIRLGDGSGGFGPASQFAVGRASDLAVGDFNNDGKPDLAARLASGTSGQVTILINTTATGSASLSFTSQDSPDLGGGGQAVAVGDLNGDGWLDLAATVGGSIDPGRVAVLLNDGSGGFGPATMYPVGVSSTAIVIADFDGDGRPDLAVPNRFADTNSNNASVSLLLNNGNGSFAAATSSPLTTPGPRAIAAGDFNGDGRPDLAISHGDFINTLSILLNTGAGSFGAASGIRLGGQASDNSSLKVADFTGDGKADIAVVTNGASRLAILASLGDGSFAPPNYYAAGNDPTALAIGDFNGDGQPDLAVTDDDSLNAYANILLNQGGGSFATPRIFEATNPFAIAVSDLNGDGIADLAIANTQGGGSLSNQRLTILLSKPAGGYQAAPDVPLTVDANSVAAADFNGDGKPDLAVAAGGPTGGGLLILLGDGHGGFGSPGNVLTQNQRWVATGDFNNDGRPDLAVTIGVTLRILLNTTAPGAGSASFIESRSTTGGSQSFIAVGDLNGDGKTDVVMPNQASGNGTVLVLLGDGAGGLRTPGSFPVGSFPSAVAIGDLNGDGKADLAVTNSNSSGSISILLGDGSGSFGAASNIPVGRFPSSLAIGDFNGDGKADLAVAIDNFGNNVPILLGDGSGGFTAGPVGSVANGGLRNLAVSDLNGDGKADVAVLTGPGAFNPGYVQVFLNSASLGATLGNTGATGTILDDDADNTPVAFTFSDRLAVPRGSPVLSEIVTLQDITFPTPLVVVNGFASINGGECTRINDPVAGDDKLRLCHTASNLFGTSTVTTVTVGTYTTTFTSTTEARDVSPATFLFTDVPGTVSAGSIQRSNAITVAGINDSTPFNVTGGRASSSALPCDPLTGETSGMVSAGSVISVCHVAGPAGSVNDTTLTIGAEGVSLGVSDTFTSTTTPAVQAPAVSLDMNDLHFGRGFVIRFREITLNTSSEAQVVTLTNTGNAPLSISSIVTTGDFRQTSTCGTSVAPSGQCTISIIFKPTAIGTRTGETRITSNAATSPDLISLSGTGKGLVPAIKTNAPSYNFGNVKVGAASPDRALIITSSGTGPLEIRSIAVSGDYSGSHNCPRFLDAGKTCTLTGRFKPKATGSRPGSITITTSAPNSPTVIPLSGNGT
ncbi:MAG: FG-GAP-like repeat-containing protein [Gammaproteobacteria bacterium]|nr:FG-GAP-like repeat-containing protein [Gammaproteobacteria bacterium]